MTWIWKKAPQRKMVFGYRDPVSRFVSGFNSRKRKGRPKYNVEWSRLECVAFQSFNHPVELAESLSSSTKVVRSLAEMCMYSIQHVNKSHFEYLGDKGFLLRNESKIIYPYSVDTLSEDFEIIKLRLGIPHDVKLSSDEKSIHKSPGWMNKEMSDLGERNLQKWYSEDYKVIDTLVSIRESRKRSLD